MLGISFFFKKVEKLYIINSLTLVTPLSSQHKRCIFVSYMGSKCVKSVQMSYHQWSLMKTITGRHRTFLKQTRNGLRPQTLDLRSTLNVRKCVGWGLVQ
jgi:hypothetical protein